MSVAAVILAAGFSRRLGRPKQTVVIGGETLLERAVRTAAEAGLDPVFVVLQPGSAFANPLAPGTYIPVPNAQAEEGLAASVRAGVQAAQSAGAVHGLLLMTCDQIATSPEHLRALAAEPAQVSGSGYAGRTGVPAYFPRTSFADLLVLKGDAGARMLLREARVVEDERLALDLDTEDDVARAKALLEPRT